MTKFRLPSIIDIIAAAMLINMLGGFAFADGLALKSNAIAEGKDVTIGDLFDNAGDKAGIIIARAPLDRHKLVYSADSLQFKLRSLGIEWANSEKVREVTVWGRDASLGPDGDKKYAQVNLSRNAANQNGPDNAKEIAVLNREVPRNEVITSDMIVWTRVNDSMATGTLVDATDIIGKTASHNLSPNMPLRNSDLTQTMLIKKGQGIVLVYEYGAMRITATGKALSDGARGANIKVANSSSNGVVDAIVEGNGYARVIQNSGIQNSGPQTANPRLSANY